jgi:hypothetical protein
MEFVTKAKPKINSVEVHSQLSNNRHPVDGVLVGAGSLWPKTLEFLDSDLFIYLFTVQRTRTGSESPIWKSYRKWEHVVL